MRTLAVVGVVLALLLPTEPVLAADASAPLVTVDGTRFVDSHGREVVLRGFNVSGEVKLAEKGGLPFGSAADARTPALAMRNLTNANSVRFLLSWAAAEPTRGVIDTTYLAKVAEQAGVFADLGFEVLLDFHQDLFSRYLFNSGSWYTGDGAPQWLVQAGAYPQESCGICVTWGQNITQNAAVQQATYDFWHNRILTERDAFLAYAKQVLVYLRANLGDARFARMLGVNPFNEPFAGTYDSGQNSRTWERDVLWPFYVQFRGVMDAAGWAERPAFVEPNLFWNGNVSQQAGGFLDSGAIGPRYVFNSHFYDQQAISGVLMWGKATDGQESDDFAAIRDRAAALSAPAFVSEFGHPLTGYTSDKAPSVDKAMYQGLDSRLPGAQWWTGVATSGPVLSGTQWQWDIYSGRHHELMNGNADKVQTAGDGWNGEDFSAVALDDAGTAYLRQDARLLDRVYPAAVAGRTLAFVYEDRSRDGTSPMSWTPVPSRLPNVTTTVNGSRYAVLVWRSGGDGAATEVKLPAGFRNTVVADVTYAIAADGRTLSLTGGGTAGVVHFALITDAVAPSATVLAAARTELSGWAAAAFG
ncbi:cellulase family glycosylhydrolase [Paractinoplanes durhamensis]|uniref:Endoglycosylceramidase n=1 Tax=Paractinoplanes durhamensis TaxID=113563 RepID=A0ABQ3Z9L1_9ACTN|nr:cellulase family glycosylhydrolase [Actinoplanes durhamensis]GIE06519.1 endoglycosylceramidase [Actinoplanes durhamensis]